MKDNSFDSAMSKIVGQHEAEVRAEARATKRSQVYGQIRGVVVFLLLAAALVVAFNFREQLKDLVMPKHALVTAEVTTNADGTFEAKGFEAIEYNVSKTPQPPGRSERP